MPSCSQLVIATAIQLRGQRRNPGRRACEIISLLSGVLTAWPLFTSAFGIRIHARPGWIMLTPDGTGNVWLKLGIQISRDNLQSRQKGQPVGVMLLMNGPQKFFRFAFDSSQSLDPNPPDLRPPGPCSPRCGCVDWRRRTSLSVSGASGLSGWQSAGPVWIVRIAMHPGRMWPLDMAHDP